MFFAMTAVPKRLLTLCLALAFLVGVTVQLMPPTVAAAETLVSADMSGGCARPEPPCAGQTPNCVAHLGCVTVSALPAVPASVAVVCEWTALGYVLAPQALSGISVEPELSPPILAS
jgi:hypothetical protein